jgi:hypothetical protein
MEIQTYVPIELTEHTRGRPVPELQVVDEIELPKTKGFYLQHIHLIGQLLHPAYNHQGFEQGETGDQHLYEKVGADRKKHLLVLPTRESIEFFQKYCCVSSYEIAYSQALLDFFPSSIDFVRIHELGHLRNCVLDIKSASLDEGLAIAFAYRELMKKVLDESFDNSQAHKIISAYSEVIKHAVPWSPHRRGFNTVLGADFTVSTGDFTNGGRLKEIMSEVERKINRTLEKIPSTPSFFTG